MCEVAGAHVRVTFMLSSSCFQTFFIVSVFFSFLFHVFYVSKKNFFLSQMVIVSRARSLFRGLSVRRAQEDSVSGF